MPGISKLHQFILELGSLLFALLFIPVPRGHKHVAWEKEKEK